MMEEVFQQPAHFALAALWRRIPKAVKLAFASSFAGGLLVYLFALTNPILGVGDALTNVFSTSNQVGLGRWSSAWLCALTPYAAMPLVNGLLMILAVSLLSALAVAYLEIRSPLLAAAAGLVMVCYPSVGNTLKYLNVADGYMIAALLSVLSLFLVDRFRFGWIWGIPLFTLALGTYQAYFSLVAALMLVRAVRLILRPESENRMLLGLALRYVLYALASLAAYYALVGVFNRQTGIPLTEYQSVSNMGNVTLSTLLENFVGCYRDFKKEVTFLSFRPGYYVSGYPNYLYIVLTAALIGVSYLAAKGKTALKTAALLALGALAPFMLCSIRIFNPAKVYSLMTYSMAGVYLLGLAALEGLPQTLASLREAVGGQGIILRRGRKWTRAALIIASWLMILCLILCLYAWAVGINLDYFEAKLDYENMYAQCSLYLQMAEAAQGYREGMPVYVLGTTQEAQGSSRGVTLLNSPKAHYAFMTFFLGVQMPYGIAAEIDAAADAFRGTQAYLQMPAYPAQGCVAVMDSAVYIKLSDGAK